MYSDDKNVEVQVYMSIDNLDQAREDAQDLAWEHSISAAQMFNASVGSDEHAKLFKVLSERYEHGVEHLMFFMEGAFALLRTMFDTGIITLDTDHPLDNEEVMARIGKLAQLITSSYMYLAAGYETLWPINEDMPSEVGTTFHFTTNEIHITESDND